MKLKSFFIKLNNIDKQKRLLVMIIVWFSGFCILLISYFLVWQPVWLAKQELTRIESPDMLQRRLNSLSSKETPEVLSKEELQRLYKKVPINVGESEWLRTVQHYAEESKVNVTNVQYDSTDSLLLAKQEIEAQPSDTEIPDEIESPVEVIDGTEAIQKKAMDEQAMSSQIIRHQYSIKGKANYSEWIKFLQLLQENDRVVSITSWTMQATNRAEETVANQDSAEYSLELTMYVYQLKNGELLHKE